MCSFQNFRILVSCSSSTVQTSCFSGWIVLFLTVSFRYFFSCINVNYFLKQKHRLTYNWQKYILKRVPFIYQEGYLPKAFKCWENHDWHSLRFSVDFYCFWDFTRSPEYELSVWCWAQARGTSIKMTKSINLITINYQKKLSIILWFLSDRKWLFFYFNGCCSQAALDLLYLFSLSGNYWDSRQCQKVYW